MPPCATPAPPNEPTVPLPERALRRLARARGAAARSAADAHRSRHAVRRVPATVLAAGGLRRYSRSEEHTSELQSRLHLVCRLLLEKKKKNRTLTSEHF